MDRKEYGRKWREMNKDRVLESARMYRIKNKETIRIKKKADYENNKEKYLKLQKSYYESNREHVIKINTEWAKNNPTSRRSIARKATAKFLKNNPWLTSFHNAKRRCNNPRAKDYKYYGKTGIKFLMSKIEYATLWERDKANTMIKPSIDRINPYGNYEYSNCRFIEFVANCKRPKRCQR